MWCALFKIVQDHIIESLPCFYFLRHGFIVISVDDDVDKKRNKTNTKKRLKKRSQVVESDDESISWNTGNCIRSVFDSDNEDGFIISSVRKNKKTAKNIISESNACGDASKPEVDDPKR